MSLPAPLTCSDDAFATPVQPYVARRALSTELSLRRAGRLSLAANPAVAAAALNAGVLAADLGASWRRLWTALAGGDATDAEQQPTAPPRVNASALLLSGAARFGASVADHADALMKLLAAHDASSDAGPSQAVRTALVSVLRGFGPMGARSAGGVAWADLMAPAHPMHVASFAEVSNAVTLLPSLEVRWGECYDY